MEDPRAREDRCRQEKGGIREMLIGQGWHDRCCGISASSNDVSKDLRLAGDELFQAVPPTKFNCSDPDQFLAPTPLVGLVVIDQKLTEYLQTHTF